MEGDAFKKKNLRNYVFKLFLSKNKVYNCGSTINSSINASLNTSSEVVRNCTTNHAHNIASLQIFLSFCNVLKTQLDEIHTGAIPSAQNEY